MAISNRQAEGITPFFQKHIPVANFTPSKCRLCSISNLIDFVLMKIQVSPEIKRDSCAEHGICIGDVRNFKRRNFRLKYANFMPNPHVIGWGLSRVFDGYMSLYCTSRLVNHCLFDTNVRSQLPSSCIPSVVNQPGSRYYEQACHSYEPPIWSRMTVRLFGDLLGFLIAFRGWGYFDSGRCLLDISLWLIGGLVATCNLLL